MPITLPDLQDWTFTVDFEGIAWAVIDRKGESMNALGRRATEELGEIVKAVEEAPAGEIKGLVLMSGKESSFIAGADIREFEGFDTEDKIKDVVAQTLELLDRIDKLPVPVVAAIHGYCLGGGLELALACDWRIADREEGTRLGFPEVKLGIFPGLNGTVRAIQAAGPVDAMTAMLTGKMLRPTAARAMGFVDQLVPTRHNLRWAARKAVLQKRRSKGAPWWKKAMLKQPVRGMLAKQMRTKTAAKVREDHYPAPFRLIDLFERYGDDPARMKRAETEMFTPLMASETSRNLRRVFRLSEMLKDAAPKDGFKPRRVHVIGAGTMGGDIAAWCVVSGMQASLQDLDQDQINKALSRAKKLFKRRLRGKTAVDSAIARLIADPEGKADQACRRHHRSHRREARREADAVCRAREESEARRGAGDEHLVAQARGHRQAAQRSRPPRGLALLQPRGAVALGRGRARRGNARGGGRQGLSPSSPPSTSSR